MAHKKASSLSTEYVTGSGSEDDVPEVPNGGSDDPERTKDTGVPLTDRASGSDGRKWVGGKRVVERLVIGAQGYKLHQWQHEFQYHEKAGSFKGIAYKAGDANLHEMAKHLKAESTYRYLWNKYPCTAAECKAHKTCFVDKQCDLIDIVYDPNDKLPYGPGDCLK